MSILQQLPTQIWHHRIPKRFTFLIEGFIKQNIKISNCPFVISTIILINGYFSEIFPSIVTETLQNPDNIEYIKELKNILSIFEQQPRNSWDVVMLNSLGRNILYFFLFI